MMNCATWQGRPISLEEFMSGGGVLAARCGNPNCDAVTPLTNSNFHEFARMASVVRLEEGVRCSCGWRGGSLTMLAVVPADGLSNRCYLFHG
jgi:hypothetical protein